MTVFFHCFVGFLFLLLSLDALPTKPLPLISTESDPDAFIEGYVNVINGNYCESTTDLLITGPDPLILQRFYSSMNGVDGSPNGGWRILPQRFLVVGKGFFAKSYLIRQEPFAWSLALTGECSGGILPYTGWRNEKGWTQAPLKIDAANKAIGIVNTYAKEINGQTNHQSRILRTRGSTCELVLGDGTKRIYQQTTQLPSLLLGEELTSVMASQVWDPEYFLLSQETLPSGNHLLFSYDGEGHLISIEMKNRTQTKTFSWMHFTYNFQNLECRVMIETSDAKSLTYHFSLDNGAYNLVKVEGSHIMPVSYKYKEALVKKTLPEGSFTEIEYENGKAATLKTSHFLSGKPDAIYSFSYGQNTTDVFNALGIQTRYIYDTRFQLTAIERYDHQGHLHRVERKFWGNTQTEMGRLLAKTIEDGHGRVCSYQSFLYDKAGNIVEERLYGNLTGQQDVSLKVSPDGQLLNPDEKECHIKSFEYSSDGFNLLTKAGNVKGCQTLSIYKTNANLLIKKFILSEGVIKKRTFYTYNDDGVCIKTIEDDVSKEEDDQIFNDSITERHMTEIQPKETLPGVGLPLVIIEKALNLKRKQEVLIKKSVNTYDTQSRLISCDTYDARNQYAFTEQKGTEVSGEGQFTARYSYDLLGRKISSTDRFGNSTLFEYDAFDRLTKIIYPEVFDENHNVIRPTMTYTYNLFGHQLTFQDPKGFITTKSYNLRGDPSKIIYPDGSSESFTYDTDGRLHQSLDRDQIMTVYEYDYLGRTVYEETSTVGEKGEISILKKHSYQYSGFRCISECEDKCVKKYSYGAAGRLTSIIEYDNAKDSTDPESRCTEMIYGARGRLYQKKIWFGPEDTDYRLECFEYDRTGNLLKKQIKDAEGRVLYAKGFSYNLHNQCIEEYYLKDNEKQSLKKTSYDTEGEPTNLETRVIFDYTYQNALGQNVLKKSLHGPDGSTTEMEFDALGRIHSIYKKDPAGELLSSQTILYDSSGNKACNIHDHIVDGNRVDSQKNLWVYGPNHRLEEEVEAAGTPFEKRTRLHYDPTGKMVEKTIQGMGGSLLYSYDKSGRLCKIKAQDSKKDRCISNSYIYDEKGNIIAAYSSPKKHVMRTYDAFNQLIQEDIEDGEGSYSLKYAYDRCGRIKEIVLPDQSKIIFSYDALCGRFVKRLSAQDKVLYTHTYDHYDDDSSLDCDPQSCLVHHPRENFQLSNTLLCVLCDLCGKKNLPQGSLRKQNERKDEQGPQSRFEDNLLSQLITLEKPDKTAITFSYDPFGRLLVQKHLNIKNKTKKTLSTSRYFYLGHQEIGSLTKNGEIETLKVPGLNGDQLSPTGIAFELKGKTYLPVHDHSGHVIKLIDSQNRKTVESYQYTAFGQETIYNAQGEVEECSQVGNPWRYAEKRTDQTTGLIFFDFCFYHPTTGKWMNQDPVLHMVLNPVLKLTLYELGYK